MLTIEVRRDFKFELFKSNLMSYAMYSPIPPNSRMDTNERRVGEFRKKK